MGDGHKVPERIDLWFCAVCGFTRDGRQGAPPFFCRGRGSPWHDEAAMRPVEYVPVLPSGVESEAPPERETDEQTITDILVALDKWLVPMEKRPGRGRGPLGSRAGASPPRRPIPWGTSRAERGDSGCGGDGCDPHL
jgi:hypothetical protein